MSVLLDTHAALWLLQGDPRLSAVALKRLSHLKREQIYISDLLFYEVALFIRKGKVAIEGDLTTFLRDFAARFTVLPLDSEVASQAIDLPLPQGDPFDRVFVATALRHKLPLVTRDRQIRDANIVETIW